MHVIYKLNAAVFKISSLTHLLDQKYLFMVQDAYAHSLNGVIFLGEF